MKFNFEKYKINVRLNLYIVNGEENMQIRKIPIHYARANMTIAENIYDSMGLLLVTEDTALTPRIIIKLKLHGVNQIGVYDYRKEIDTFVDEQMTYLDRVRQTKTFKSFQVDFSKSVDEFRKDINEVVTNNKEIDIPKLTHELDRLLAQNVTGSSMFEMLQCMREYDDLTYVHSLNVGLICHVIGGWLNFSKEDNYLLSLCGLLHDVGKLCIPKKLITKPGKLTAEEFTTVKAHAYRGYEILKKQNIDERIKLAALMHHEKCDGTGYPDGLKSEQIIDFAKIVAVADVYDAMTANRVYRAGLCPFDVIELFESEGLQKFDPKFLLPFLERTSESYINHDVYLSNGQKARVIMINKAALSKPVVQVSQQFIDLSQRPGLHIRAIL